MSNEEHSHQHVLHDFQRQGTRRVVFEGENIVVVQPTGTGKTAVFTHSALLLRGVSVLVSPLLAVSANHFLSINSSDSSLTAVVTDFIAPDKEKDVVNAIKEMESDCSGALVLIMSPKHFTSKLWKRCLKHLAKENLLRLLGFDEMQVFALDSVYRKEFKDMEGPISKLNKISDGIRTIAMTATLTQELRNEFCSLTGIKFNQPDLWQAKQGHIALYRTVQNRTTDAVKDSLRKLMSRNSKSKVAVFSLERGRARNALQKAARSVLIEMREDAAGVDTYDGDRAKKAKLHIIKLFKEDSVLRILTATYAGALGVDSSYCDGVCINGTMKDLYVVAQMLGRTGRLGSATGLPPECHFSLSVSLFEDRLRLELAELAPMSLPIDVANVGDVIHLIRARTSFHSASSPSSVL